MMHRNHWKESVAANSISVTPNYDGGIEQTNGRISNQLVIRFGKKKKSFSFFHSSNAQIDDHNS